MSLADELLADLEDEMDNTDLEAMLESNETVEATGKFSELFWVSF